VELIIHLSTDFFSCLWSLEYRGRERKKKFHYSRCSQWVGWVYFVVAHGLIWWSMI